MLGSADGDYQGVFKSIQASTEGNRNIDGTRLIDMMMERRVGTEGHQAASMRICIGMKGVLEGATAVLSRS